MKRFVIILCTLSMAISYAMAEHYTVYVKVPGCDQATYEPAIVGQMTDWNGNIQMTKQTTGSYSGYYMASFDADKGSTFKFREKNCTGNDWSNEIVGRSAHGYHYGDGWYALDDNTLPDYANTMVFDYSDATEYAWLQCRPSISGGQPDNYQTQTDMPVMYIRTKDNAPVNSKDVYVKAYYYLDSRGVEGVKDIASKEVPDTMQIKGRGNWTWNGFEKKPYRLKLNKKTALLGLDKSKHFGLLAHADDWSAWMKNTMGFLLSEQMGLQWTPKQQPVEVVLNGDYIGLYMLTELIRVDKDRVNIVEQPDLCTNKDTVTGGWLVEIDNYKEDGNVEITEPEFQPYHNSRTAMFTPKTPEILSTEQRSYLTNAVTAIQNAIYNDSDADFARLVNIEELAKFYLVQEIMSNCESFNGSCYMHKNIGAAEQWYFGPVWDFGNCYDRNNEQKIYEGEDQFAQKWIARMMQHKVLQDAVQKEWDHWRYYEAANVSPAINAMKERIRNAAARDAKRWPQYDHSNVNGRVDDILNKHSWRVDMLTREWGAGKEDPVTPETVVNLQTSAGKVTKVLRGGQIVIIRGEQEYNVLGY